LWGAPRKGTKRGFSTVTKKKEKPLVVPPEQKKGSKYGMRREKGKKPGGKRGKGRRLKEKGEFYWVPHLIWEKKKVGKTMGRKTRVPSCT